MSSLEIRREVRAWIKRTSWPILILWLWSPLLIYDTITGLPTTWRFLRAWMSTESPATRRAREVCDALVTTLLTTQDATDIQRINVILAHVDCGVDLRVKKAYLLHGPLKIPTVAGKVGEDTEPGR